AAPGDGAGRSGVGRRGRPVAPAAGRAARGRIGPGSNHRSEPNRPFDRWGRRPGMGTWPAMPGIDLHVHSVFSDGTFTPREAVMLAHERGLSTMALTDHDTVNGLDEAFAAGDELGVEIVPGIEFSTVYEGNGVHVLCYFMDAENPGLGAELKRLQDDRYRGGGMMVEKLQELGYPITFDRVREIAEGGNIVRPHVAQALVEAGVVPTTKDAFTEEFIGSNGRAYVEKHALHPLDALRLIHGAGGACVLAHPGTFRETKPVPATLIDALAAAGLDGLEV